MILADLIFSQDELLVVQNPLRVTILSQYPEGLRPSMKSRVPLELFVRPQLELNSHSTPSDGLHDGRDL